MQGYALLNAIRNVGYVCEIIDYDMQSEPRTFSGKRNIKYLTPEAIIIRIKKRLELHKHKNKLCVEEIIENRKKAFDEFRRIHMNFSICCDRSGLFQLQDNYDAIVCGSDQIWNPGMNLPSFFLDFVDDKREKVIYAASIGRNMLSKEEKKVYGKYLTGLKHISVREEKAKELIEDILTETSSAVEDGRFGKAGNTSIDDSVGHSRQTEVAVLLDPTLLINAASWKGIARENTLVKEKYMFCYFLGLTEEKRNSAISFAKKHGLKIISIPYLLEKYNALDDGFSEERFPVGPAEFLNLILHAEFVLTDSFHASVFSILFNKRFRVFGRSSGKDNMNSRIDTLLGYIGKNEYLIEPGQLDDSYIEEDIDYDFSIINEKRELSIKWLSDHIKGRYNMQDDK